jgi:outer membrane protein, heavy metal efflux system
MIVRALPLLVVAAACAPTRSELRAPVDRELAQRMGGPVDMSASIDALLAKPITRESAVKIAVANNARVRAALEELGIAGGDLASALGLGPLDIDISTRFGSGGAYELEVEAIQNVIGLVTAPRRRAAARADLAAARALATAMTLRLVARVEIAFDELLAAQQELELRRTAFDAADAAAMVRERMRAAGNTSELAQARDRDAREQTRVDVARAEANVEIQREQLNGLLGLSGAQTKWITAGTLAELPAAPPALDDLEQAAVVASLDLSAGRERVAGADNTVGAERVRAFLPELGVGVSVVEHGAGIEVGPALRLGIPLFDHRSGARARARATLAKAELELHASAIELRANARAARVAALSAYQEARHLRDVILPLRQQIVDQTLLHYNAMDANPFELIIARRDLADAGHQYLDALRRFWSAMSRVVALRRGVDPGSETLPTRSSSSAASTVESH